MFYFNLIFMKVSDFKWSEGCAISFYFLIKYLQVDQASLLGVPPFCNKEDLQLKSSFIFKLQLNP